MKSKFILKEYSISDRKWTKREELSDDYLWTTDFWWCSDGDGVTLYINKDGDGMRLECFSGIPASFICIDMVDFGTIWDKAHGSKPLSIAPFTFEERSIIIADYLCCLFCEYKDVSYYEKA